MTTKVQRLCVLALAVAASGCVDNNASVEMFGICAPPTDAQTCTVTAGACGTYLAGRPYVYTTTGGAANQLELFMQVNDEMPQDTNVDAGHTNSKDAFITEFDISFTSPDLSGIPSVVYPASSVPVAAGGSSSMVVALVPANALAAISSLMKGAGLTQAVVVSNIVMKGHFNDGQSFKSGTYSAAVDVVDANFIPQGCATAGDVAFYCPNPAGGQTDSFTCGTP
jgi:Na+(H+)/acetate symporter ActP